MRVASLALRLAVLWAIPIAALVVLSRPIAALFGSGGAGLVIALFLIWVTLIPFARAAADVTADLIRQRS